jgi:hypothetical protein
VSLLLDTWISLVFNLLLSILVFWLEFTVIESLDFFFFWIIIVNMEIIITKIPPLPKRMVYKGLLSIVLKKIVILLSSSRMKAYK